MTTRNPHMPDALIDVSAPPPALMGLDTEDGKGERAIVAERGNYTKPLITPSGARVVYSTNSSAVALAWNVMPLKT